MNELEKLRAMSAKLDEQTEILNEQTKALIAIWKVLRELNPNEAEVFERIEKELGINI